MPDQLTTSDLDSLADAIAERLAEHLDRPALLDQSAAMTYVGLSRSGWFRAKSAGLLPASVYVEGSGERWRRRDLDQFVERLKPGRRRGGRLEM